MFKNYSENTPRTEENVIENKNVVEIGKSLEIDPSVWLC